ncbi:MAG: hypothetical protein WCR52_05420 [Bacteroidota bacterium]
MRRHLILSTLLLALSVGITAFVSARLPKRNIGPALTHQEGFEKLTPFEQYLSQFPKRELPFSFDIQQFTKAFNLYRGLGSLSSERRNALRDSIDRICNQLMYFPEQPRLLNVTSGYWRVKDSLPGDYLFKNTLQICYYDLQREEAVLIPVMAFETPEYHATITFIGHSAMDMTFAKFIGKYQLDYYNKSGKSLGSVVIAALDELPFMVTGALDKNGRFKHQKYRRCRNWESNPENLFEQVDDSFKLPDRLTYRLFGNEFIKSMAISVTPVVVSDDTHK